MAHLEILPPNNRGGVQHMSSQDDDGLLYVQDMSKRKNFLLYKNDV
jgi:hypothetical protein